MECPACVRRGRKAYNPNQLSKREAEVFALIAQGYSNGETAKALFIHHKTVKFHLTNIYKKLKITGRAAVITGYYNNSFADEQLTHVYPILPKFGTPPKEEPKKETLPHGQQL